MVFDRLLIMDEPIEFCPPGHGYSENHRKRFDARAQAKRRSREDPRPSPDHQKKKENKLAIASLLRVNKDFYAAAARTLYGKKEFRFSNSTGCVALDLFIHQIGIEKAGRIRNLTVCHPSHTELLNSHGTSRYFWEGMSGGLGQGMPYKGEGGFRYRERWWDDAPSCDPELVLEKAGKLQHLSLVLDHHALDGPTKRLSVPVDEDRFEGLKVTFLCLCPKRPHHGVGRCPAARLVHEHNLVSPGKEWE
jgi:hypothetical protein